LSNKVKISVFGSIFFLLILGAFMAGVHEPKYVVKNKKMAAKEKKKMKKKHTPPPSFTFDKRDRRERNEDLREDLEERHLDKKGTIGGETPTRSISYSDPINDRVLGDPRWAATNSREELEAIERAFDVKPEDPDIIRFSRQRSIDKVKPVVFACFDALKKEKPNAKGRIIVEWMAEKGGKITHLKLGPNVDLRYPSFTDCILENAQNLSFRNEGEDHFIEYPFALF